MAHLEAFDRHQAVIEAEVLHRQPWAILECKRVGVEEGVKKGPQTIEKAKQGAYVARTISALQKIRLSDGQLGGLIYTGNGGMLVDEHSVLMDRIIESQSPELLGQFILSVGIVSNHGNWFTGHDRNKELEVLAAAYDWLVFLTDHGLTEFIQDFLLDPTPELKLAQAAFLASYAPGKRKNRFTKVQMDLDTDEAIQRYFAVHQNRIERWFRVISPAGHGLPTLRGQLSKLRSKDWQAIHSVK